MNHLFLYTSPATLTNSLQENVQSPVVFQAIDGLSFPDDHVLNYLPEFPDASTYRGGFLRLILTPDGKSLQLSIEIETPSPLSPADLKKLHKALDGQISDGIGEGAFDFLSQTTDLSVKLFSLKSRQPSKLESRSGAAWLPSKDTHAANDQICKRTQAALLSLEENNSKSQKKSKDPKPLLRLLAKIPVPLPDSHVAAIAAEIEKLGNDLSTLEDKKLPFKNMTHLPILKMLLDANLRPNILDVQGHSLLWLAAVQIESLELILARGADINIRNDMYDKETPLMRAAFMGLPDVVQFLLQNGADPTLQTPFGDTAEKQAQKNLSMYHNGKPQQTLDLLQKWSTTPKQH